MVYGKAGDHQVELAAAEVAGAEFSLPERRARREASQPSAAHGEHVLRQIACNDRRFRESGEHEVRERARAATEVEHADRAARVERKHLEDELALLAIPRHDAKDLRIIGGGRLVEVCPDAL